MGLFDFFKKKNVKPDVSFSQIVTTLDESGYFKYAETSDIPELKKEIESSLSDSNYLSTIHFAESPFHSKDYRHYHFDGEDLFEADGFTGKLNDMKNLFDKMNFKIDITNYIEDYESEDGINQSITLNGKNYIIFKKFTGFGWGEAAQRFAEIINDQLEIQGINERLYLCNGGNDGNAVFLTEEQFELLDPILKHATDRPLRIEDWCRVMQVDPKRYSQ